MSKKLFSLIHGDRVHVSPNTKVISGSEFSKIVDAREVLRKVEKDTEQFRIDVTSECEKLKERAQKEGFEQGYSDWIEKIAELEEEIQKVRKDMERIVVPIALKAAKKIVGRELEVSETAVTDIITASLKGVSQHKKVTIYVNRKDWQAVEKSRQKIKKIFENLETLSIRIQDDIGSGGCIIETEGGIINAQLENQWMILENAFQKMLEQRPLITKGKKEKESSEDK